MEARAQQMKERRDATDAQIEKLLTDEQKARFVEYKQQETRHMKDGRGTQRHHDVKKGDKKAGKKGADCCKEGADKAAGCCGAGDCDKAAGEKAQ